MGDGTDSKGDPVKIPPHSVQSRLEKWGQWVQQPRQITAASSSPFGRIAEERNAAGNHGDGIRYEIIDGVACPPDGGLAREMERKARAWGHDIRCREVHEAVGQLPDAMRKAITDTYVVPDREDPRSAREVARRLDRDVSTVEEALEKAHKRVARAIFGPFTLEKNEAKATGRKSRVRKD